MTIKIINLFAAVLASCVIMILHELPKSMAYGYINRNQPNIKKHIFRLGQYIDPIGLIFSVTCYAGFSKPYMYRIKDKRTNLILGLIGFASLLLMFLININLFNIISDMKSEVLTAINDMNGLVWTFISQFVLHMAWLSLSMFIVNFFPVSTFDISLIIAAKSPSRYFFLIQQDHIMKLALILGMVFGLIRLLSQYIIRLMI